MLLYLQGLQDAPPPDDDDMGSKVHSPAPRTRSIAGSTRRFEQMAGGTEYEGGEDIRSDVQEGNGSDLARTIQIQTTGIVRLLLWSVYVVLNMLFCPTA